MKYPDGTRCIRQHYQSATIIGREGTDYMLLFDDDRDRGLKNKYHLWNESSLEHEFIMESPLKVSLPEDLFMI